MDAMDSEVRKVIDVAKVTMMSVPMSPTFPTTQPKRKYMITPRMVSMEGVNTPPNVFSCFAVLIGSFLIIISFYLDRVNISIFKLSADHTQVFLSVEMI